MIIAHALIPEFLQLRRAGSVKAVRAIIRRHIEIRCHCPHLILKNQKILIAGSHNHITVHTMLMQPLYLRIHRCGTDAARDEHNLFLLQFLDILIYQIRRTSKRSHEICERIPLLQGYHALCGSSHRLKYDRDRTGFPVIITDCERNTLPLLINLDNDKLSRFAILCNTRCLDIHQIDLVCQLFFFNNRIHNFLLALCTILI